MDSMFYFLLAMGLFCLLAGVIFVRHLSEFSIRTKLFLVFMGVAFASGLIIIFGANYAARQTIIDRANGLLLSAARQTATDVDAFINTNLDTIRVEAQLPEIIQLAVEEGSNEAMRQNVSAILNILSRKDPVYIRSYALLDAEGVVIASTKAVEIGRDESAPLYFKQPRLTGLPYVSSIYVDPVEEESNIYFSGVVRQRVGGPVIGVLRVKYNATVLQQLIQEKGGLGGEASFAMLVDDYQIRMAHGARPDLVLHPIVPLSAEYLAEVVATERFTSDQLQQNATDLPELAAALNQVDQEPFFLAFINNAEGMAQQSSAAVVSLNTVSEWRVVFAQPQEIFLAPLQAQTGTLLLLTGVTMLLIGIVAFFIGYMLTAPIIRLTAVAQQVTAGDLSVRAKIETEDEIGQLAKAFNEMTKQLRDIVNTLANQVDEQTARLKYSLEISQRAATLRDLGELLPIVTEMLRQRFKLYYVQIYLLDDTRQFLVLRAATGPVGQELLEAGKSLPVDDSMVVGQVVLEKEARIESGQEELLLNRLPETQTRLLLPLIVGGEVIGVLELQAIEAAEFSNRDLTLFEGIAIQLATSIDGAQQLAVARTAQKKSEETLRQLTQESWQTTLAGLKRKQQLGYYYDLSKVEPLPDEDDDEASPKTPSDSEREEQLIVPLVVQRAKVGQLKVDKPTTGPTWSNDDRLLLESVAEQLSQKAENLRLFEETQQQAVREQITRRIADKIRASRNIETALQIAAEELSKALRVAKTEIELKMPSRHNRSEQ